MEKGGQSAMEYLMTYGWAILIILIALGALFYLGVFSPSTPSTCFIQAPFVCKDVIINDNGILFNLGAGANIEGASVTDVKINGESCSELNGFLYNTEIDGESYTGCAVDLSDTNKISSEIELSYSGSGGLSHNIGGDASGSLEEGSIFNTIEENGIFHLDEENLVFGWDGESSLDYVNGVGCTNNGVEFVEGYLGGGGDFNGISNYIGINEIIIPDEESYTISLWVYVRQWDTYGDGAGLFNGPNGRNWDDLIRLRSTKISIQDNSGSYYSLTANNINLNTWHHVVIIFSDSNINGYIDNVATTSTNALSNTLTLDRIGQGYGSYPYLNGIIDEVHIWDRALSPEEVENLYNSYI